MNIAEGGTMNLPPDSLLRNRYRIQGLLGQGGMGAVYLALDTALDTQVAIKANRSPAPDSSSQFLREARLLAALRHPHLPRVTDYFILDGVQYLVMDFIPGQDLASLLKESGRQPLDRALAWVYQLGGALSFLHHQNPPIIHRDVKPANIRITEDGQVILVDFGIAKVFDPSQATTAGAMGYTPGYAPPEQYGGTIRTGPYTDQYSLAALLYHLLTGQKPEDAIQRALNKARLTPVGQLAPHVPLHVRSAIERALAVRPEERYPDIDDFLSALKNPLSAEAEQPAPPAGLEAAVISPGPAQPPPETPPAPAAAPKRRLACLWAAVAGLLGLGLICAAALVILLPRLAWVLPLPQPIPTAAVVSDTPQPAAAVPSIRPSPMVPPTDTPRPLTHTPTPEPSPTAPPTGTPTPEPTPTLLSIGGGGKILFASNRADGSTFQLWTLQVSLNDQGQVIAGSLEQLTSSPGDKRQPVWSPDGRKIAYVAAGSGQDTDIWVMNADGSGDPVDLTHLAGNESEPAWSPDGRWIAFTNDGHYTKARQIYLIRPDGSEVYKLSYDQEEFGPAWSPDLQLGFVMNLAGAQVMYIRGEKDPKTGAAPTREYYVTPSFFDRLALHGNLGQVSEPAWSPDGKWLAYTRQRGSGTQIYLAHFPVRSPVEKDILMLTDTKKDSSPAWSPDGQWIVFTSTRDGNAEIYIMRTTGQNQSNLTHDPAQDVDPVWFIPFGK